ncbi:ABC transporter ATP-binding protein [Sphingomonas sp. DBB INV C78]|uniref:ATP-binding cassette domain-containing protein n=1 Tax=Sphingomonas sp. DBB INV C78 TaxID=3349434 RepID=UPI0036D23B3E
MTAPPIIALTGVSKRHGDHVALDRVDLAVDAGSFVALVGPSGAGKTTLLKTINRLVTPDEGAVLVDGADVRTVPVQALRRGIGYVFQGIGLFPHMTVAQNIWIVPDLAGVPADGRTDRVAELLALVALPPDMAGRLPAELSGGQAQRVGLARALANGPQIMLMDEPFGALDPITRDGLRTAYRALHDRLGLTTIMVTHDMEEALLLADRVVVLDRGRIRADAPPADLLAGHGDALVQEMTALPRSNVDRLAALMRQP